MRLHDLLALTLTEATKEPVGLPVWDDREWYPWGPLRGENQKQLQAKNAAVWDAMDRAPIVDIPYASLTSIEKDVYPDRVQKYMNEPPEKLPTVIVHNGKRVLWDGTHRISARIRAGHQHGPVRLADLDAVLTPEGRLRTDVAESVIRTELRGEPFRVYVDPTSRAALKLAQHMNELRGIVANGHIYLWDAARATHEELSTKLGLPYGIPVYVAPEGTSDLDGWENPAWVSQGFDIYDQGTDVPELIRTFPVDQRNERMIETVVYRKVNPDTRQRWTVNRNPTQKELLGLMARTTERRLRGWVETLGRRDFYIWDASQGTHDDINRRCVPMDSGTPIEIVQGPAGLVVEVHMTPKEAPDYIREIRSNANFSKAIPVCMWDATDRLGTADPFVESLSEARIDVTAIPVWMNPTAGELLGVLQQYSSQGKNAELRGIVDKQSGDVFVWWSFEKTHGDMAHRLGLFGHRDPKARYWPFMIGPNNTFQADTLWSQHARPVGPVFAATIQEPSGEPWAMLIRGLERKGRPTEPGPKPGPV